METWGTPALTGCSCEDFPSRTTHSHLLLRKEEISTHWRVQLACKKVQAHNSLENTIGIQSGPDAFDKSRFVKTFLTILGVTEVLCSSRFAPEGKTGKEILSQQDLS